MGARALPGVQPLRHRSGVRLRALGLVELLEEDPDLAPSERDRAAAGGIMAKKYGLERGPWIARDDHHVRQEDLGFLVLEGALVRHVTIGSRRSGELVGPGDVIRPGQEATDAYAQIEAVTSWTVLEDVRMVAIDRGVVSACCTVPSVLAELSARLLAPSGSLAARMAMAQLPKLELRLELLLWHLADRWGRREQGHVVLSLPLSQALLAELLCAQRTSVNAAMQKLVTRGVVGREGRGRWVLSGAPPAHLLSPLAA